MTKIDDRFIFSLTNGNVELESNGLIDCKNLIFVAHDEFTDRRDILAGDRLKRLDTIDGFVDDFNTNDLTYRKYLDYAEYKGNLVYTYVLDELQFTDSVLLQRLTVYKNGEVSKVKYVGGDALEGSFRVDHMLAYVNDLFAGLAR